MITRVPFGWTTTLKFMLMLACVAGLWAGCDSGSGSSDDEFASFVFVNDTNKRIQVMRDGGTEWDGAESFQLVGMGAERTVALRQTGKISYAYVVLDGGSVKAEQSGREIFFRYN